MEPTDTEAMLRQTIASQAAELARLRPLAMAVAELRRYRMWGTVHDGIVREFAQRNSAPESQ